MDEQQTEQERRWQETIAGLVEIHSNIPDHEVLKPRYVIGVDRVWRVRFHYGGIGWARAYGMYGHANPKHYLPPALALECQLAEALAMGFGPDWARSDRPAGIDQKILARAILSASPARQAKLQADIDAERRFRESEKRA